MEFLLNYTIDVLTATVVGLLIPSVLLAGYIWWCDRHRPRCDHSNKAATKAAKGLAKKNLK